MSEVSIPEEHNEHYKKVLAATKTEGDKTAEKRVPELYYILKDEEGKSPSDAREMVKQDLVDTFARVTVDKWIPEEAKKKEKVEAGRIGGKKKARNSASAPALSKDSKSEEKNEEKPQEIVIGNEGNILPNEESKSDQSVETVKKFYPDIDKQPKVFKTQDDPEFLKKSLNKALEDIRDLNIIIDQERKEKTQLQDALKKQSFTPATDTMDEFHFDKIAVPMLMTELRKRQSSGWHFVRVKVEYIS